jgi:hypothetical protein
MSCADEKMQTAVTGQTESGYRDAITSATMTQYYIKKTHNSRCPDTIMGRILLLFTTNSRNLQISLKSNMWI